MSTTKKRAKDEALGELHIAIAEQLLKKINSGEATAAEYNAAIKFLADNNIEVDATPDSAANRLAKALPVFDDEQDEQPTAH